MTNSAGDESGPLPRFKLAQSLDIARVPSDFPVRFCLLTEGEHQYVAYYDRNRQMTVASRAMDGQRWQTRALPTKVEWDSHNYITMAVDGDRRLHVSGNMHNVPLIYFRTDRAGDISSIRQQTMTGADEQHCTYPQFMRDASDRLVFHYRNGASGNGADIYNVYDETTERWTRLLDKPLLDGEGKRNAYALGPVAGPEGWFHLTWVWRDTSDCATNHHLSHARSRDLLHWESAFGDRVDLSLILAQRELWVDPIPVSGGIINGCQKLFFDADNRPVISYHKSDARGKMQLYAARPEGRRWAIHQLTDWDQAIAFSGRGSMSFIGIGISGFSRVEPGLLTLTYRHREYGRGQLLIDEKTLRPVERTLEAAPEFPWELEGIQSDFTGMEIQRVEDLGGIGDPEIRYILQWETLSENRDRPREPPLPEPGMLRLYTLQRQLRETP